MSLQDFFWVASGGAVGAVARYVVGLACIELLGPRFPWGTLIVNLVGCLLLGLLWQATNSTSPAVESAKLALGTGFLGAFTTFSAFGLQTVQAWERSPGLAAANIIANVGVGVAAVLAGIQLARLWDS